MLTRTLTLLLLCLTAASATAANPTPADLLHKSKRMVFLGDSITYSGQSVAYFEAWLLTQRLPHPPLVIDAGLPSETVSGLSEEGHAGGKFPRPDLAERLDRVLAITKPDLVVACYGMNCGIYLPFDEQRFEKYQSGIKQLKQKVEAAGAQLILCTPPFYDDLRAPRPFSYNEVLDKYSAWLVAQRKEHWLVIDTHSAMTQEVAERRKADPKFTFQNDGVHPNDAGSWVLAREVIHGFGGNVSAATPAEMLESAKLPPKVLPLVQQRVNILRDSYVGTAGHKRPGVAAGLKIPEVEVKAAELTKQIDDALKK